ncbi:hypothetical protein B0H19DRAFT_1083648 [Mycena capillaripes]|nr:hypothetical protein B0H19DRAFT_1083648 [Mycena capillaripes]
MWNLMKSIKVHASILFEVIPPRDGPKRCRQFFFAATVVGALHQAAIFCTILIFFPSTESSLAMRKYTQADVDDALLQPPSPSDAHGWVYAQEVVLPNGSVVVKLGRSDDPPRRTREWEKQCWKDKIRLVWVVETNHATKLERVCHRLFTALGAWVTPFHCESCYVRHQEKFLVEMLGGWDNVKEEVERMAKIMRDQGE